MTSFGHIVVCLVAYRNSDDIMRCLSALALQSYPDFEVIICENGGAASYVTLLACLPERLANGQTVAAISDETNPGYAGGINRCIAARPGASGYWILNPDTIPEQQALGAMVHAVATGHIDAAGGPIVLPSGVLQTCGGKWQPLLAYSTAICKGVPLDQCPEPEVVAQSLSFISGASLFVSDEFLRVAGLMREDYFLYGEEVEWCLRASALGLRLGFCRDAVVMHYQGTTTGSAGDIGQQSRLAIYCDERNRILTLRDTADRPTVVLGILGALILIVLRYVRRGAFRSMMNALHGWWSGVRDKRGKPAWLPQDKGGN